MSNTQESPNDWPLAKFSFTVKIGEIEGAFQEISGLNAENEVIEYRKGNSPNFSTQKMPGIKKYGNITLKKGIFKGDKELWDLFNSSSKNSFDKKTVTISLLDETNGIVMSWKLTNAFPVKFTGPDLNATSNEVAIETMELAHEGLSIIKN